MLIRLLPTVAIPSAAQAIDFVSGPAYHLRRVAESGSLNQSGNLAQLCWIIRRTSGISDTNISAAFAAGSRRAKRHPIVLAVLLLTVYRSAEVVR
jgi:hypothetical protein